MAVTPSNAAPPPAPAPPAAGALPTWLGWIEPANGAAGTLHGALRMAASVLSQFDPGTVEPFGLDAERPGRAEEAEARARLRDESESVGFRDGATQFALHETVRRAALAALGTRERMAEALRANSRPDTPTQRVLERFIAGFGGAETLDFDEAAAGLTVSRWLEGVLDGIPSRAALERQLGLNEIGERLERVAGREFLGREEDVEAVEALLAASHLDPLLVYGPGGIGKSTLVARIACERFPRDIVAWLDADRPSYDFARPDTVFNEILRQAAPQLESGSLDRLQAQVRARASSFESVNQSQEESVADFIGKRFRGALKYALGGRRLLIVVDTFEEVQLRGAEVEANCAALLVRLRQVTSDILAVFAGRAKPGPEAKLRGYELPDLDGAASRRLLETLIPPESRGSLPDGMTEKVAEIVGGNPLSLRLAASVLAKAPGRDFALDPLADVLAAVRTERMQGMLYARILSHIRSDDARKVALPGLVVRLLTAELIEKVLAKPCKLDLPDAGAAGRIMSELAREVSLLEPGGGGALRHRQDVRRIMLQDLLSHLPPETIAAIDKGAVDFWASKAGGAARAEEIYHRLRLDQEAGTLDERWLPEAAPFLPSAMAEIPHRAQLWLAGKLDISVDEGLRAVADLASWETQAERRARRLLGANEADKALGAVRERAERSEKSPLYALEGEILRALGRDGEARELAVRGSQALAGAGAFGQAAELRLLASLVDESEGRLDAALAEAEAACRFADVVHDAATRLRPLMTRIRLLRKLGPDRQAEYETLRSEALGLATPDLIDRLRGRRAFVREIVAELGGADVAILRAGIATLGLDTRTEVERQTLAEALATIGRAPDPGSFGAVLESGEVASRLGLERGDAASIRQWLDDNGGAELSGFVAERLASESAAAALPPDEGDAVQPAAEHWDDQSATREPRNESSESFADFFRSGVETSLGRKWE